MWIFSVMTLIVYTLNAHAKVSSREADKLGVVLTPFGSIKSGSQRVPAWHGGLSTAPKGYMGAGQHHIDPFLSEEISFTIDSSNYIYFKKYLTAGQLAMFKAYPGSFKMNVYPSHRTHAMPNWINQNTRRNAKSSSLSNQGAGIKNAYGGIPFPILHGRNRDKALQAIWNHMTRWRGVFVTNSFTEIAVHKNGNYTPVSVQQEVLFNFHRPNSNFKSMDNVLLYFISFTKAPALLAGGALLVHETLDQVIDNREAWDYSKSQRRIRRAPNLAYDSPIASSNNTRTVDDTDMFNGATDRYDWAYKGLKEYFIPYNNYKIGTKGIKYADLVMPGHINSEYLRWEAHRVHVVEASLKKNERHIYQKRLFFIDEDSWGIALVDQYDHRGNLWRVSMALLKNFYELPGVLAGVNIFHDLQAQSFSANGLYSEEHQAPVFESGAPSTRHFKPSSLRQRVR